MLLPLQIVEGRLDKIKKQYALLEQPALRDNNKTVGELIKETIAATGENIQVRGELLHITEVATGSGGCAYSNHVYELEQHLRHCITGLLLP